MCHGEKGHVPDPGSMDLQEKTKLGGSTGKNSTGVVWCGHRTELEGEKLGVSIGFEACVGGEMMERVEQRFGPCGCRALQHGFEAHGRRVLEEHQQWEGSEAGFEGELKIAGSGQEQKGVGNMNYTGWSKELVACSSTGFEDFNRFAARGQWFMEYVIPALCLMQRSSADKAMCWQLIAVATAEDEKQVVQTLVQAVAVQSTLLGIGVCNIVQQLVQHIGLNERWCAWWITITVLVITKGSLQGIP